MRASNISLCGSFAHNLALAIRASRLTRAPVPASYFSLDQPDGRCLLVTTYCGRTDPAVSNQVRAVRAADPARRRAMGHLIDLGCLEGTVWPTDSEADTFRRLAERYAAIFGPLPTVLLATAPHVVGLARIFQISAGVQTPPVPVVVVGTVRDAAAFLACDLTLAVTRIEQIHGHVHGL